MYADTSGLSGGLHWAIQQLEHVAVVLTRSLPPKNFRRFRVRCSLLTAILICEGGVWLRYGMYLPPLHSKDAHNLALGSELEAGCARGLGRAFAQTHATESC